MPSPNGLIATCSRSAPPAATRIPEHLRELGERAAGRGRIDHRRERALRQLGRAPGALDLVARLDHPDQAQQDRAVPDLDAGQERAQLLELAGGEPRALDGDASAVRHGAADRRGERLERRHVGAPARQDARELAETLVHRLGPGRVEAARAVDLEPAAPRGQARSRPSRRARRASARPSPWRARRSGKGARDPRRGSCGTCGRCSRRSSGARSRSRR